MHRHRAICTTAKAGRSNSPPRSSSRRLKVGTMYHVRKWERFQFLIDYEHQQAKRARAEIDVEQGVRR